MEGKRLREILNSFVESDYNLIVVFNPVCKEMTQRILLFNDYIIPRTGIDNYTVRGRDITDLVESLKVNSFEVPGKMDLGLSSKIETLPVYSYLFFKDYSFEIIRK
jgi:hypothetical protein